MMLTAMHGLRRLVASAMLLVESATASSLYLRILCSKASKFLPSDTKCPQRKCTMCQKSAGIVAVILLEQCCVAVSSQTNYLG